LQTLASAGDRAWPPAAVRERVMGWHGSTRTQDARCVLLAPEEGARFQDKAPQATLRPGGEAGPSSTSDFNLLSEPKLDPDEGFGPNASVEIVRSGSSICHRPPLSRSLSEFDGRRNRERAFGLSFLDSLGEISVHS
jgi:hypothetical protein